MNASKIKIFEVIDSLGLGGAQRQLAALCAGIDKSRFEVHVVSLCDRLLDYKDDLEKAGVNVYVVPQKGKFSPGTLKGVRKLFRDHKPDLVHCWLFSAGLYGRIAARLERVKAVVYGVRNTLYDMPAHYRWVDRVLSRVTQVITVNADSLKDELVFSVGVKREKLRTIYNGIDLEALSGENGKDLLKAEYQLNDSSCVVAMIARMADQKDYGSYLEAAFSVCNSGLDAVFFLIGDGPMKSRYEQKVKDSGFSDRIRFTGARRDVFQILKDIDICVLMTFSEGCSNVIMEAMAASRPVIAADAGGNKELILHGKNGFIVPQRDVEGLTGFLKTLIADKVLRREMGLQGRKRAEAMLSLDRMVRETDELYVSLTHKETEKSNV